MLLGGIKSVSLLENQTSNHLLTSRRWLNLCAMSLCPIPMKRLCLQPRDAC